MVLGSLILAVLAACDRGAPPPPDDEPRFSSQQCGPGAPPLAHGTSMTVQIVNLRSGTPHELKLRYVDGPAGEVEVTHDLTAREVVIRSSHRDGPGRTDQFEVVVDMLVRYEKGDKNVPLRCKFAVAHTADAGTGSPPPASPAAAAPTQAPTTTSRPAAATGASTGVRVNGQPATYSGPCSQWQVTFVWIIEGTPAPATFQRRTARGTADYGPEEGPFLIQNGGPMTWDPSTGRLTLRGAGDVGPSPGFRSQITKVGGKEVTGDATSIAAPGYCS